MSGPIETSSVEDWERQFTINLRTAYLAVLELPANGSA